MDKVAGMTFLAKITLILACVTVALPAFSQSSMESANVGELLCDVFPEFGCDDAFEISAQDQTSLDQMKQVCRNFVGAGCLELIEETFNLQRFEVAILLAKSCKTGDIYDCAGLSYLSAFNDVDGLDQEQALLMSTSVCELGQGRGCNVLGLLNEGGVHVNKDFQLAAEFYQTACEMDFKLGCFNLGRLYRLGRGVEQNVFRAMPLLLDVCNWGLDEACVELKMSIDGELKGNSNLAYHWRIHQFLCDADYSSSCSKLGRMARDGSGVDQDFVQALELFEQACGGGDSGGCFQAGWMYYRPWGVTKDLVRSIDYFQRSCDLQNETACDRLEMIDETSE